MLYILKKSGKVKNTRTALRLMLIFAIFSAIIMTGCDLSYLGFRDTTKGALKISVDANRFSVSRSILPTADMSPAEYHITGAGPGGATFDKISTGSSINVFDLAIGSWSITVTAHNSDSEQIGWGEAVVLVTASTISDATILVEPYTGKGTVSFSATWNESDVADPGISAVLTDTAGSEMTLDFTLGTGSATYVNGDLNSGYYTLNIKLLDGGTVVSGLVESVRVLQDFQTTGNFSFADLNSPTGDVSISVIVNMYDPFEPVINGASATIAYGTNMTVSATVPDSSGETLIYKWYANGELVGSTNEITFGNTFERGYYRLDLVITNAEGTRSGSATHSFTIE